jgi:NAD(P)H-dependent FMN reductase
MYNQVSALFEEFGWKSCDPVVNKTIRILGIAGSMRRESYNRASTELVSADATIDTFELDGIPLHNQDEGFHLPTTTELEAWTRRLGQP